MKKKMRLERLEKLKWLMANHSQEFPRLGFDMNDWHCGTAACALGSAALHPWFNRRGLHMDEGCPVHKPRDAFYWRTQWQAGAEFFGITVKESEFLFTGDHYEVVKNDVWDWSPITPQHVIEHIDILIERYS